MIPVVIVFGLVIGGATGRLLPAAASAALLSALAISWGLLVVDPLGIFVAGVNGVAGTAVGFLLVQLGTGIVHRVK